MWTSTDPQDQDWNVYKYCGNNPIRNIDPNGDSWLSNAWQSIEGSWKRNWADIVGFSLNPFLWALDKSSVSNSSYTESIRSNLGNPGYAITVNWRSLCHTLDPHTSGQERSNALASLWNWIDPYNVTMTIFDVSTNSAGSALGFGNAGDPYKFELKDGVIYQTGGAASEINRWRGAWGHTQGASITYNEKDINEWEKEYIAKFYWTDPSASPVQLGSEVKKTMRHERGHAYQWGAFGSAVLPLSLLGEWRGATSVASDPGSGKSPFERAACSYGDEGGNDWNPFDFWY